MMRKEVIISAMVVGILIGLGRAEPIVVNGSFEANTFTVYPGYVGTNGPIPAWSSPSTSGLNPVGADNPFADNGWVPDGRNAAFVSQAGYLSQDIPGFEAGVTYRLTYYENARAATAHPYLEVRLGDQVLVASHEVIPVDPVFLYRKPYHRQQVDFTVPAGGTYTLKFDVSGGGNAMALIDQVGIVEVPEVAITNPSFEANSFTVWPGYVSQNGPITGWICTPSTGLNAVNGQYPFADNGAIPHGRNAAFIQDAGSIRQTIRGLRAGAWYRLMYYENCRAATGTANLQVNLGTRVLVPLHTVTPVDTPNIFCRQYHLKVVDFVVPTTDSYTLTFSVTYTGVEASTVIDDVTITKVTDTFVHNGSFEFDTFTTYPGYGAISGWTSSASNSGQNPAGGNLFADNGIVPDGGNVAFIQQSGYLRQTVSGLRAGVAYRLTYYENARASASAYPGLQVSLGSQTLVPLHTVTPVDGTGTHTHSYTKKSVDFTVPYDGNYALQFTTSASADCALLLDNVTINEAVKEDLTPGHYLLLKRGLQIHGLAFPVVDGQVLFSTDKLYEAYFTGVNFWGSPLQPDWVGPAPGPNWARCYTVSGSGTLENFATQEIPYADRMVNFQYGDEIDITDGTLVQRLKDWIALNKVRYPGVICHDNQAGNGGSNSAGTYTKEAVSSFLMNVKSDMTMFDSYPFLGNLAGGSPTNFYKLLASYRWIGLQGLDAGGTRPIPSALFLQTYPINPDHIPAESELRLNQFSAWTFGYKLADAFVYTSVPNRPELSSILFSGAGDTFPTSKYYEMAETNRQSRNLGPALVRLLSTDVRMVMGRQPGGATNALPAGVTAGLTGADPYLTGVSATNPGSKNGGLPGDVIVGFFKVLHESLDGPNYTGERYFMVTNGLSDAAGTAAQTRQNIHITFNFGSSGLSSLQRLSRDTGSVETVPLVHDTGSTYYLDLTLDGGTGDLFKYNTGAPFVGVGSLAQPVLSVSPASQSARWRAGQATFVVTNTGTGSMSWAAQVTGGQDWLTIVSGSAGTDNGTITVAFTENGNGTGARTGTLRILASGTAGSPMDVTIVQNDHPIPGDADGDGTVSFADFAVLQNNYGRSNRTWEQGDFNGDGQVSFEDFSILQNQYGQSEGGTNPLAAETAATGCGSLGVLVLSFMGWTFFGRNLLAGRSETEGL